MGKGRVILFPEWKRPMCQIISSMLTRKLQTDRFRLHFWGKVEIATRFGLKRWSSDMSLAPVTPF